MPDERPTIGIVEDSPVLQSLLEAALEDICDILWIVADGRDAVETWRGARPDLIVLDLLIPGMTGVEVLEAMREEDPDTRVVVASAVSDAKTVMRCMRLGAVEYLHKPYSATEIRETVAAALAQRE